MKDSLLTLASIRRPHIILCMIRALTDNEIRELLEKECYGHLGCIEDHATPHVIPITFVYHKNAVYGFSFTGMKIDILRKNPHACFQIEHLREPTEWRSAMVWGTYEELAGNDREDALSLIIERLWRESNRDHPLFLPFRNSAATLEKEKHGANVVLYRINIEKQTGRLEQYEELK